MQKISLEEIASRTPETATLVWTRSFLLNLPVPLLYAFSLVRDWGFVGLILGLLLTYATGWVLAQSFPSPIRTIAKGGYVVAATQLFPLPQTIIGMFAMMLAEASLNLISGVPVSDDELILFLAHNPFKAFLATIATGVGLLLPAFGIGLTLDQLFSPRTKPKPPPLEL